MFRKFQSTYRCYPIELLDGPERMQVNHGGKIILPPSALQKLTQLNIQYPMIFELSCNDRKTNCGVLEFIAEEGRVYIPSWLMRTLGMKSESLLTVTSTSLELGTYVKIQPQSENFLEISDPKAVLEQALRNFSSLTIGDIISILYNDEIYEILIMETKPSINGISVIETDLETEFAAPLGYIEPDYKPKKIASSISEHVEKEKNAFTSFHGSGERLSGREETRSYGHKDLMGDTSVDSKVPNVLKLPLGYPVVAKVEGGKGKADPFAGEGKTLRRQA